MGFSKKTSGCSAELIDGLIHLFLLYGLSFSVRGPPLSKPLNLNKNFKQTTKGFVLYSYRLWNNDIKLGVFFIHGFDLS